MLFFSNGVGKLHQGFKNLFQLDDEEGDKESQGQGEESGVDGATQGDRQLIFLSLIDEVAETTRTEWEKVFRYEITYFFNIITYARWKAEREKKQAEEWKRKH